MHPVLPLLLLLLLLLLHLLLMATGYHQLCSLVQNYQSEHRVYPTGNGTRDTERESESEIGSVSKLPFVESLAWTQTCGEFVVIVHLVVSLLLLLLLFLVVVVAVRPLVHFALLPTTFLFALVRFLISQFN